MRALIIATAALATGCSFMGARDTPVISRGQARCASIARPIVDALIGGQLAFYGAFALDEPDGEQSGSAGAAAVLVAAGAVFGASAIYGFVEIHACKPRRAEAQVPLANRERAWRMTLIAQQAAHAGDCASVIAIAPNVQMLSADYYQQFLPGRRHPARLPRSATASRGATAAPRSATSTATATVARRLADRLVPGITWVILTA